MDRVAAPVIFWQRKAQNILGWHIPIESFTEKHSIVFEIFHGPKGKFLTGLVVQNKMSEVTKIRWKHSDQMSWQRGEQLLRYFTLEVQNRWTG